MLHIELRDTLYRGTTIEIQPDDERLIPRLRDMVECNFQIENPVTTFANIHSAGGFDGISKDVVNSEAEKVDYLSKAWTFGDDETGVPAANIMQVLTRLMELYIETRRELSEYIDECLYMEDDFDNEFEEAYDTAFVDFGDDDHPF